MTKYVGFVDFETAGLYDDAVVLSFGMTVSTYDEKVVFDDLVKDGLYLEFDYVEQVQKYKRKSQKSVMEWWKKQSPEARAVWNLPPKSKYKKTSLADFEMECLTFLADRNINPKDVDLYDRKQFDVTKMQHIQEETLGIPGVWWNYQNTFEVATALRMLGFDRYGGMPAESFPGAIYHNALHDSAMDHVRFLNAFQQATT